MGAPDPPYFVGELEEVTNMPVVEPPMSQQLGYEMEDLRGFQSYLPTLLDEQEEDGALDELPYPAPCMADGFNTFPDLPAMPPGLCQPSNWPISRVNCVPQRTPPPAWGMDAHHPIQPAIPTFHSHCQEDDLASMSIRSEVFHDHVSDHWRPRLQDWMMHSSPQPVMSQGRLKPSQVLLWHHCSIQRAHAHSMQPSVALSHTRANSAGCTGLPCPISLILTRDKLIRCIQVLYGQASAMTSSGGISNPAGVPASDVEKWLPINAAHAVDPSHPVGNAPRPTAESQHATTMLLYPPYHVRDLMKLDVTAAPAPATERLTIFVEGAA
jgi:hypothetical protein